MDEVMRIKKDLERTVPRKDTKQALELLKSLESIPMTLDVLQKTHIGMTVNKLRRAFDDPEINPFAKGMVKKWKKLLPTPSTPTTNSSSAQQSGSAANSSTSSANNGNNNGSSNNNPHESNSIQNPSGVATNQRGDQLTAPVPSKRAPIQAEVPATTSDVRLKCRVLLSEALKTPLPKEFPQESFLDEETLAACIEDHIYLEFKDTGMKYKNRLRSRVCNLKDSKNPYLRLNVLRGDIRPERIAKMTAEEMASDELKKEREKFTKEAINDHQMSLTTGTKTSEIKCPACKKYDVTYNQVQTRSADEPMTTFCYCNECGKRWKFC